MKILIVEDEQKTLRYLTKALEENGFVIDGVDDGIDGLHMALEQDYEAIILDVMLPGIDGYQVLERLRKRKQTPVLMLSALRNRRNASCRCSAQANGWALFISPSLTPAQMLRPLPREPFVTGMNLFSMDIKPLLQAENPPILR